MNRTRQYLVRRSGQRIGGVTPCSLPSGMFVDELLAHGLSDLARESFQGSASPARLRELGEPVVIRADRENDEIEALVRLAADRIALIDVGYGHVTVEVAATSRAAAEAAAKAIRGQLDADPPQADDVSVAFWMRGDRGGSVRHREIDAPTFDQIGANYAAAVRAALTRLLALQAPDRGRLLLWRGAPGTGKSHALRALVRAWAPWCSAHFIIDPEELFGHGGAYLLDVLTWDGDDEGRWRLVILEDCGELIASDARSLTGQGLSRLLNVADGLLGQGTRTLVLITTNEPLKRLHPATRRPGRCLADIEFTPLAVDEANAWLRDRDEQRRVDRPTTLAELYAHTGPDAPDEEQPPQFGFARALADAGLDPTLAVQTSVLRHS